MISRDLVQKAKHMREITGFGLHECRDLLLEFGNMEDALDYQYLTAVVEEKCDLKNQK